MNKINHINLNSFCKDERINCYWFWFRGRIKRERIEGQLVDSLINEWSGIRFKNGFNLCFDVLNEKYMNGRYNGQTKAEFDKNFKRVSDIWVKSDGDVDKAVAISKTQANRIHDEFKALNRAMAAKEMGYEEIFEIFFHRAYELGSVSKLEYREYKLEKLGI